VLRRLDKTVVVAVAVALAGWACSGTPPDERTDPAGATIRLPEPRVRGEMSLEQCLRARRSFREFRDGALTLEQAGQLLWAAQGITDWRGFRTAPSAGALFPLEAYLVAGRVETLAPGVYKYSPKRHELRPVASGDKRMQLAAAAAGQSWIGNSSAVVVLSAVRERTTRKYRERGVRYIYIESGHAGQNLCLQAVALGLGAATVGAFDDAAVKRLLSLPDEEEPVYIVPVGRK
jgi:SagB-type dehydrogenase family enzyme